MKVPKYYLVKGEIIALIAGLPPGAVVPTERDLAERFGTSRTTVRQAIAELVVDGRLERTQGSGTFVARSKIMPVRPLTSFSQDLNSEGWQPGSIVVDIRSQVADEDLAAHLDLPPGAATWRVERVRTNEGQPIALEVACLPGDLAQLPERLAELGSLYRVLREVYDREPVAVEDMVETALADPHTASLLDVDTGTPMLLTHRTAWDAHGRRVEWTRSLFRGDRFRFVSRRRLGDSVGEDTPTALS